MGIIPYSTENIIKLLYRPSLDPVCRCGCAPSLRSINLANITHSTLLIPWEPTTHNLSTSLNIFQQVFLKSGWHQPTLQTLAEIYQRSTNPKQAAPGFGMSCSSCWVCPRLVLVAANLSSQHSLSQAPPQSAQEATNLRSLCSSYQAQGLADISLHQRHSQEVPEPTHPVSSFKPHKTTTQLAQKMTQSKDGLGRHQSSNNANSALWNQPINNSLSTVVILSQSAWRSILPTEVSTAIMAQLQPEATHGPHKGHPWSTQLGWSGGLYHWAQ